MGAHRVWGVASGFVADKIGLMARKRYASELGNLLGNIPLYLLVKEPSSRKGNSQIKYVCTYSLFYENVVYSKQCSSQSSFYIHVGAVF